MAVETQNRIRSNAHASAAPGTPAIPAAPEGPEGPARRTRPGQAPAPVRPVPVAGTRPRPSASAAEVVTAYLKAQVAALRSLEPQVRADEFDSVHQMRVATRRLRATLRSFGQVIPRSQTSEVAAELKWLGGVLGPARDGEVLPRHLHASLEPVPVELVIGPVRARVQGYFAPRRASAREQVIEALDSPRYTRLMADLDRLALDPPWGPKAGAPARDVLPAAVRRAYKQAKTRMRRARRAPSGQARDVALHEVRKSARRARYAAEAAGPASGKPARKFARQMKKVQSVIGDHQDTVIARQSARELGIGAHLAGENAFTYGLLHEREHHQAERLQSGARRTWKKASRPRHRQWMR
jgi:CHAD domain-containing protein